MQWLVRSQDKKFIVSIDNVEAVTVNGKHIVRGGGRVLGEYKSTRRCVRVITNMMKFLDGMDRYLISTDADKEYSDFKTYSDLMRENKFTFLSPATHTSIVPFRTKTVYEMPKE